MTIFTRFFVRLLLACSMLAGAGQAWAGPMYRVTIDTSTLGTGPAYLGLAFLGLAGASHAGASVTGLAGDFDGDAALSGSVSATGAGYLFSNANGGGELVQALELGGIVDFLVRFDFEPGMTGATFSFALFDDTRYLGANGDLGWFELAPGAPADLQVVPVIVAQELVNAVPEPSAAALLLLAGAVMALRVRRR